jgi:hypothetical protein
MNNFEKLKSMSAEALAEWLNKYVSYNDAPWSDWFDQKYCKKCEDIICKSPDDSRHSVCAYCEIYDNCRFFPEIDDVPNSLETVKMWLESEVEDNV